MAAYSHVQSSARTRASACATSSRRTPPALRNPRVGGTSQAGVVLGELPVPDPPPVHRPGAQIFHHHVRLLRDPGEEVSPLGEPDVYAYVELVPALRKKRRGD